MPAILVLAIIIVDQLSKYYIKTHMELGASIPIIKNIFHITYVLNPGAAFGMLRNQTGFFIIVAIAILVAAIYFYRQLSTEDMLLKKAIVLLAGGAAGNVVDRLNSGHVVDFFDFRLWPVFNIADCAIVIGVSLMFYSMLFANRYRKGD